jgi:predicted nucleic acid-binding protein
VARRRDLDGFVSQNSSLAALITESARRFLELAEEGILCLQLSEANPERDDADSSGEISMAFGTAQAAHELLSAMAQPITPHVEVDVLKEDPDDNRILDCAQGSHADYLVTSRRLPS